MLYNGMSLRKVSFALLMALLTLMAVCGAAGATGVEVPGVSTSYDSMPWEGTLAKVAKSLTGPVAMAVCLAAIFVAIAVMIFNPGGSMDGWGRWVVFIALAAGTLGFSGNVLQFLGVTGALV